MKYVVVLYDGMADYPVPQFDDKTPMMLAKKPNFDGLAKKGTVGLVKTVQDGMNTMRSNLMPMEAVFRYREPCASFPKLLNKIILPLAELVNPLIKQPSPLENFNIENASIIKKNVNIPVIAVGGIHKVEDMEDIITNGKADFISMCRPFICEPDLAKKMMNGQKSAKCLMCNYCGLVIEKEPTRCLYGRIK